jgi:hypothetical protein
MGALTACVALALAAGTVAEWDAERAKKHFDGRGYSVSWTASPAYPADAELDVGYGSGHGFTLRWLRFRPRADGVEVLSVRYDRGWKPYRSKWQPDDAPVTVTRARMPAARYADLLRSMAVVAAADVRPPSDRATDFSTNDFWVSARLSVKGKAVLDLDWAGYESAREAAWFARPRAAVATAREAVQGLDFEPHALTREDRAWASGRFAREWSGYKGQGGHWWVTGRSIITVGVVGDAAALPVLRGLLAGDAKDQNVYFAINAVTRLTGKDVRDRPVEQMDIEKVRPKVLDLLKAEK